MEREGRKEAEERRCKAEDQAASRGMKMFLGCSRRKKDGRKITEIYADKTSLKTLDVGERNVMISGQTLEMAPYITDLKNIKGAGGGKRLLEGGLDSPSKRARKFDDLRDFWGGSGGVMATFMHTPRGTETYWSLSSTTESDNYLTDLGQTWNELRK